MKKTAGFFFRAAIIFAAVFIMNGCGGVKKGADSAPTLEKGTEKTAEGTELPDLLGGTEAAEPKTAEAAETKVEETKAEITKAENAEALEESTELAAISGLKEAKIVGSGKEYVCSEEGELAVLEELLRASEPLAGGSSCPFDGEKCALYLTDESGKTYCAWPAMDGCSILQVSGLCWQYGSESSGYESSRKFWGAFGLDVDTVTDIFYFGAVR